MKLNLFLVLILSGLNLFAADNEVVKHKAMEKFYANQAEEFQKDTRTKDSPKMTDAEKLIDVVAFITTTRMRAHDNAANNLKFALGLCNDLCAKHGRSDLLLNGLSPAGTKTKVSEKDSKDIQVCQDFCKNYQKQADAYLSGVEVGLSENGSSVDCNGAVDSSGRGKTKENQRKSEALTPSAPSMNAPR